MAVYLSLSKTIGKETASWACTLSAAPVAVAGLFHYNGPTLEQFVWGSLKSEVLCAGNRVFISENIYYLALGRKEAVDFD